LKGFAFGKLYGEVQANRQQPRHGVPVMPKSLDALSAPGFRPSNPMAFLGQTGLVIFQAFLGQL
jgi:hypothetical protein